jgi:uncharacterized protein (TIGR03000 family)
MIGIRVSSFKMGFLAVAGLLLATGAARAQGSGQGGADHHGSVGVGRSGGVGNSSPGYSSGFHRGLGYGGYGHGSGYPYSNYSYGAYPYGSGNPYVYGSPPVNTYSSYYYPPQQQAPPDDNKAHLLIVVPEGAEIWCDGARTAQMGTRREFASPPLIPGQNYMYDAIKARWVENGEPVEQTRSIRVQANSWKVIDFTKP